MILKIAKNFSTKSRVLNQTLIQNREKDIISLPASEWREELTNLALKPSSFVSWVCENTLVSKCSTFCSLAQKKHIEHCSINSTDHQKDIIRLTDKYLASFGSFGAYTETFGNSYIREDIAKWLTKRDKVPTFAKNLKICDSIFFEFREICSAIFMKGVTSFLLPIPKVPIFDFYIRSFGGNVQYYEVDQESFPQTLLNIEKAYDLGFQANKAPKCIFFSNPNETLGKLVDSKSHLTDFIDLCYKKQMIVIADESFQQIRINQKNISNFRTFADFLGLKSILKTHKNDEIRDQLELIVGFSVNKSIFPDQKLSSGFIEMVNIDDFAYEMIAKLFSMMISPNTPGQIATHLLTNLDNQNLEFNDETTNLVNFELRQNQQILHDHYFSIVDVIKKCDHLKIYPQDSGFSIWVKILDLNTFSSNEAHNKDAFIKDFCHKLKIETGFNAIPGACFGKPEFFKLFYLQKRSENSISKLEIFLKNAFNAKQ